MVQEYWEIGEQIFLACGENDRAEYGTGLLKYLSEQLTAEFGKGFTVANLKNMRQFYRAYQNRYTLCSNQSVEKVQPKGWAFSRRCGIIKKRS